MTTKVFAGNLSFKIGPEQLQEEFSAAGKVLSANIITRGPRSLGYGFVEFGSLEEAEKSVALLNHKNIDGREINVEVAKPRAETPQGENEKGGEQGGQPRRARRTRRPREDSDAGEREQQPLQQRQPRQNQPRNNNNNRPQGGQQQQQGGQQERRQYRPRQQNQDNTGGNVVNNNNNDSTLQRRPRRAPRTRRPRQDQQQDNQQQPQQQQFQRKKPAQPKKQQPQQERVASTTTLFVANLPFSVDDKELAEIFSKNLKVASAHVVKKRNTRSKGFGFVEFENEADQLAALKEFDGATVHERVLNVKVALTALPGEEGAPGAEKPSSEGSSAAEEKKEGEAPKAEPAKEKEAKVEEAAAPGEEKKGQ